MSLERQAALILICWVLAFWGIRSELSCISSYQLNKNAYKKRKKGMTFQEWFLYTRYRKELPKILMRLYFVITVGHPLVLAVCFLLYLVGPYPEIGGNIAKGAMWFDIGWVLILEIAFWNWPERTPNYSRWIKRRGMQPKKKK